jgi:hypothetical protein
MLRVIGPGGLARDAASAALARLVRGKDDSAAHEGAPPPPRSGAWSTVVERWLHDQVAPDFKPLKASDMRPHKGAIAAALERARRGTRAEQAAAARMTKGCKAGGEHESSICLVPLVKGAIPLN